MNGPTPAESESPESAPVQAEPEARSSESEVELERGLRFGHYMMTVNQAEGREARVGVMALAGLLARQGVISTEDFTAACQAAREHLGNPAQPKVYLANMGDKYAEGESIEIDCAARIHLCQARCCSFNFFLTAQDLDEGVARWDYGNPYWIKRRDDGYCIHCDPATRACEIHARRPHVCRKFDCRQDKRIWIDFEQRIPAPFEGESEGEMPIAMGEPVRQHREAAMQLFVTPKADEPDAP
jgi:Fe-S-cluster containining protein